MNLYAPTNSPQEEAAPAPGLRVPFGLAAVRRGCTRLVRSKNFLSLFDQAVVSATNFGTTVVVGRACIPAELGNYALALTILILWAAVEETLVVYPYAMQRTRLAPEAQAEYAGAVLVLYAGLTVVAMALLAGGAWAASALGDGAGFAGVLGVLAGMVPFWLLRELARRMSIAHLRMDRVLRLDLTVALLQSAGLLVVAFTHRLSAATSYLAVGLACGVAGGVWLRVFRAEVTFPRGAALWRLCAWNVSMGKWIFFTQMVGLANGYFVQWVVAGVSGDAAVGVYAACLTLVMLSNPFILGISNVLVPRAAQAFVEGGSAALRKVVWQSAWILGTVMALFGITTLVLNEQLLQVVYRRSEYQGAGPIVSILALGMLAHALGHPVLNGLAAVGRADFCFRSGALVFVIALITIPFLVSRWQVVGAAWGFLAAQVMVSAVWWVAFLRLVPRVSAVGKAI